MKKEEIFERVFELIHTQGPKTVTMDDISDKCGISKKTLYELFPTKENLISDFIYYTNKRMEMLIKKIQQKELNAIEELFAIHFSIQKLLLGNRELFLKQLLKFYPNVHANIGSILKDNIINTFYNNILKGKKEKIYKDSVSEELISRVIFVTFNSLNTSEIFKEYLHKQNSIKLEILHFFIHGLVNENGNKLYQKILVEYPNNIEKFEI